MIYHQQGHKKDFISEREKIVNMFSRKLLKESNKKNLW